MALVDYGSSDESGDEEAQKQEIKTVQTPTERPSSSKDVQNEATSSESTIFSSLPKPRTQIPFGGTEDKLQNILLNKSGKSDGANKKDTVKISIPSLSEFENDDSSQPAQKKVKQSKATGLFSVLPPPKNATVKESNRQLIPNVIKNQISKAKTDNLIKLKSSTTKTNVAHQNGLNEVDDDGDAGSTSFFGEGISTADQQRPIMNYGTENYTSEAYCTAENDVSNIPIPSEDRTVSYPQYNISDMPPNYNQERNCNNVASGSDTLELDDKALQILCGGKRKRNQMPVNIIELSGEEIMPDSKEWLLKQFTEEKTRSHSHKKNNGPSIQSRRKHQITYLAYQAKAQELELQNQWAQNRMSRRQTQSKYGF